MIKTGALNLQVMEFGSKRNKVKFANRPTAWNTPIEVTGWRGICKLNLAVKLTGLEFASKLIVIVFKHDVANSQDRTNNGVESFHAELRRRARVSHSNRERAGVDRAASSCNAFAIAALSSIVIFCSQFAYCQTTFITEYRRDWKQFVKPSSSL